MDVACQLMRFCHGGTLHSLASEAIETGELELPHSSPAALVQPNDIMLVGEGLTRIFGDLVQAETVLDITRFLLLKSFGLEEALTLDDQRSNIPEGHAQDMTLLELAMSPSTPVLGHDGSGASCSRPKNHYNAFLAKVIRAWSDGNVEVYDAMEGEDSFVYGVFEDGTTFTTEVPNVLCGLPNMSTQHGPPHECWTSKDETGGAWLGKVAMRRGAKTVASPLAASVINRFRYRLHQQTK